MPRQRSARSAALGLTVRRIPTTTLSSRGAGTLRRRLVVGVLVLLSLLFEDRLTFVLNPVYVAALAITAVAVWQITGDGEAYGYEGLALVGIYAILATVTFFE